MLRCYVIAAILVAMYGLGGSAAEVTWKMHTINARAEFTACAAFDVDHDGDLDIYSGGWWYEAPTWKQHKVRDVEVIRGRFDDYSNQPMDCNSDGWTDIISINYRSRTIYWIEHPGKNLGKQDWTAHVIDTPGSSETGRLHDLDGDGDLDILPNGTNFAAWYEYELKDDANGQRVPRWIKHELPAGAAGHGLGLAWHNDQPQLITSEGIVITKPGSDARLSRFIAFEKGDKAAIDKAETISVMPPDASIPILVHPGESNEKSLAIVVGRGHRYGLYAGVIDELEAEQPRLKLHAIDLSWAQCHAPLWADIDGDGQQDLVAGKRYMGHDGKDPGEHDPLCIYWYTVGSFNSSDKPWTRHVVHEGGPAGMDLDPKAVDLDGDGDVDLVAPSRHGLYWFENRRSERPTPQK